MHKHLQIALMATAVATLSFTSHAQAPKNASITPTTDNTGQKVYVNDVVARAAPRQAFRAQENHLSFWSTPELRGMVVEHANLHAAHSPPAEVASYLGD